MSRTLLLTLLLCLLGCSSAPPRVPVTGTVTQAGAAVSDVTIYFEAADGKSALATVKDGVYEVKNYQGAGLPPGTYKVAITPGRIMEPGETPLAGKEPPKSKGKPTVNERYHKVATSKLEIVVEAGKTEPFDFTLVP